MVDADGNPVKIMDSATASEHIRLSSVDIAKFENQVVVGEILALEAKVIYSDPKSGRVYVQIEKLTLDPIKSVVTNAGATLLEDTKGSLFYMTYQVSKEIKLKQVMPKDYEEQLLYLKGKRIIDSV